MACVARDVPLEERRETPAAQAAMRKEWDRLRAAGPQGCWDENAMGSAKIVRDRVHASGGKAHFGKIFEICVEKNFELKDNVPARKFK